MIQEAFVEAGWEEEAIARQRRDTRRQELEATGMECRSEDLYRVMDGRRVFVVVAEPLEVEVVPVLREKRGVREERSALPSRRESPVSPHPESRSVGRRVQGYEER